MTQQFAPFQKILVRDNDCDNWRCSIFSHIREGSPYKYVTIDSAWEKCIPYEGNEHLAGTSNSPTPPEPEFKFGDKVEVSDNKVKWFRAIYYRKAVSGCTHLAIRECIGTNEWAYCRKADW